MNYINAIVQKIQWFDQYYRVVKIKLIIIKILNYELDILKQ